MTPGMAARETTMPDLRGRCSCWRRPDLVEYFGRNWAPMRPSQPCSLPVQLRSRAAVFVPEEGQFCEYASETGVVRSRQGPMAQHRPLSAANPCQRLIEQRRLTLLPLLSHTTRVSRRVQKNHEPIFSTPCAISLRHSYPPIKQWLIG